MGEADRLSEFDANDYHMYPERTISVTATSRQVNSFRCVIFEWTGTREHDRSIVMRRGMRVLLDFVSSRQNAV